MFVNGVRVDRATVRAGDTVLLEHELLLLATLRPASMPALRAAATVDAFPFGGPDAFGIVGESTSAWALRELIAFHAPRDEHALILGESGVGKELVVRALHALSRRRGRPLVARNAATLPEGVLDAELFGNAKNYPNAGMAERAGLVGEASGSTLFLDEIGELPHDLQAHLLRVLDSGGEYQRLGDATARRADLRVVAATNRPESALKHDLAARLPLRLFVHGLADAREDIPLIARHILKRAASRDAELAARFLGPEGEPRWSPLLLDRLLRHRYTLHVRELETLLFSAMSAAPGDLLELSSAVEARLDVPDTKAGADELTREIVQEALERCGGNQERAYRELGLKNRDVLYRLMKKFALAARR
jgi:DNA-binding NtrC family response regulator